MRLGRVRHPCPLPNKIKGSTYMSWINCVIGVDCNKCSRVFGCDLLGEGHQVEILNKVAGYEKYTVIMENDIPAIVETK